MFFGLFSKDSGIVGDRSNPMDLLSSTSLRYLIALFVGSLIVRSIKRRYLTALRTVPGPFAASVTRAWRIKEVYYGHIEQTELKLHELHGMILGLTSGIGPSTGR